MKKTLSFLLILMVLLSCLSAFPALADEAKLQTPEITGFESTKDGINITWSPVQNAEKYRIYYKGRNGWTRMATTADTSYFDADVSLGTTYTYTVRCINVDESAFTSDYNTTGWKHTHYLATPEITGFEGSAQGVNIRWNAVDGAAKYRVYYKGKNGWTRMATTDKTSYLDTDVSYGSTYTYTVRCVDDADSKFVSDFNNNGWKYTYQLDTPQITGFKSTGKGVEISWDKVNGAEKYRVYYKNKNGNWVKMGESTGTSFIDDDVKVGSTYTYTVRCINDPLTKFTSGYDPDGWTYTYDPQLDTPVIAKVEAEADGLRIHWTAVDGADLYRVYYKGSKGWTKMADTRETNYLDTDVSEGHNYTYTVRCLSQGGKSFASDYVRDGYKFYYYSKPEIEDITVYMDRIELSVFAERCHNVRIYRKSGNSGWTRIGEIDSEEETFADYDVEPDKTYTYTARCVDENGTFLSYYNTTGWSKTYSVSECLPELEFFMYNGDNMALVQVKDDNKFGIEHFNMHVMIDGDYRGTFETTDEPTYIRADFFQVDREYLLYIVGVDANGNEITQMNSVWVMTMGAPTDLKAEKTGDRKYLFSWNENAGGRDGYNLAFYTDDGEFEMNYVVTDGASYEVDLSEYPEDTEWTVLVWAAFENNPSVSMSAQMDFKEMDY